MLPVGSVVTLKDVDDTELMITAYAPIYKFNDKEGYFDYRGCIFPVGVGAYKPVHFNTEDIDKVLFKGYESGEFSKFNDTLNARMKDLGLPKLKIDDTNQPDEEQDPLKKLLKERGMA